MVGSVAIQDFISQAQRITSEILFAYTYDMLGYDRHFLCVCNQLKCSTFLLNDFFLRFLSKLPLDKTEEFLEGLILYNNFSFNDREK